MNRVTVALSDVIVDLDREVDLEVLPVEEAEEVVRKCYAFLPTATVAINEGVATIEWPVKAPKNPQELADLIERAEKQAGRGGYVRAIDIYKKVLERQPDHVESRRNLGMAYLESDRIELAKQRLVEAARLAPDDAWTFLLLGNLFSKNEDNSEKAARFYQRAYTLSPDDPYLLCGYGGTLIKTGKVARGRELLERAREVDPDYPNSYYGIALVDAQAGQLTESLQTIDSLFGRPKSSDPRSESVYAAARALYLQINKQIAERAYDSFMQVIEGRKQELESQTGNRIEVKEDNSLSTDAVSQMAWNHNTDTHRIKYKNKIPAITPHHLAHELEHIHLEHEARQAGRNRAFATTIGTREIALRSISKDIFRLQRSGYPEGEITSVILQLVGGLANQLFNTPLDMVIEYRVFERYPELRPSQFVSLHARQTENASILTNRDIRKITPPSIFRASNALNCAYALFTDHIYGGKTEYARAYQDTEFMKVGQELFGLWQRMMPDYQHGDEYKFVDEAAKVLALNEWYEWRENGPQPAKPAGFEAPPQTPEGSTNPELLKQKHPATVMYCLSALRRFEQMDDNDIRTLTMEVATVGQNGIDYSDPDRRYHLRSAPGEEFSGLQLLALMYVGFKKIAPEMDTQLDFQEAYEAALQLHEGESG